MTKREIVSALRGALYILTIIGLYWLMLALADAGGLF